MASTSKVEGKVSERYSESISSHFAVEDEFQCIIKISTPGQISEWRGRSLV